MSSRALIADDGIVEPPKPRLVGSTQTFEQDGDCWVTEPQTIEIEMTDGGGGSYWVLTTERWAINDIEDLIALLEKAGVERRAGA